MCGGPEPEHTKSSSSSSSPTQENTHIKGIMSNDADDSFSSLLEFAANNDIQEFKLSVDRNPSAIDEVGLWYGRKKGSNQMVLQHRTPLMVAATYGSLDVLKLILSLSDADRNMGCGSEKTTALHCAASGGSENTVEAVRTLVSAGADPNCLDANGNRPADVILVSPKLNESKFALEELLGSSNEPAEVRHRALRVSTDTLNSNSNSNSPPSGAISPSSDSALSPMTLKQSFAASEKKEYPIDPTLPDIKNSIYATDEFRMFSFKVRPCSRAYSHDWTECPFVHPGENARRRDPRKFHYSCVPCPEFRKGACRRGDMCEYAHGVFECWLHPAQYRTRLCKDGTGCARRVCFFAHTNEELRPLYMSTGSAMPSPRSCASPTAMELAMGLLPGTSPASLSAAMTHFTTPMSPSSPNGSMGGWPHPNVPMLSLPGTNFQSSRLRSSLSARDMMPQFDEYSMMAADFEQQHLLNDLCLSRMGNRTPRTKTLNPANLDDLFSAEVSLSPRSAILNQLQQQQQNLLSPVNAGMFSPKSMDSHGLLIGGRMSPRSVEPVLTQRQQQQQTLRSLSSRDLGSRTPAIIGSPMNSAWATKWGSPSGTLDWGVDGEELGRLRRSSSFELRAAGEEPDLSWVHSLVKESPTEKPMMTTTTTPPVASGGDVNSNPQMEGSDHAAALGAWIEQMQLDQMVA